MNILEARDIVHSIMDFLPDIRVLQVSRKLDRSVRIHPDYTVWRKCRRLADIYRFGLPKMLTRPVPPNALYLAARHNNVQIMSHLTGDTDMALIIAARHGHLDAVKFLVAAGADIRANRGAPLIVACSGGHTAVVEFLLDCGADLASALTTCVNHGQVEIVKILSKRGVNLHYGGETPLRLACVNGHLNIVMFLVEMGADIHVFGNLPLHHACAYGHLEIVKFLAARGVGVGNASLAAACDGGHIDVVKFLISGGADADLAVEYARRYNRWNIVEYLIGVSD